MDSFSKVASWATQSTTGQGFGIVAGVFAAVQSGSMTLAQAGPAVLIGLILIVWPQKQATAQAAGAVATDMETLFSAYRTGLTHGASAAQAGFGVVTDPAAGTAVSDIAKLLKAVTSPGAAPVPVHTPVAPVATILPPAAPVAPSAAPVAAGLLALVLAGCTLVGCSTTALQTEATRLASINQILCQGVATAQPVAVGLASTVAIAADPADATAVAAAIAADNSIHAQLQAACPAGTAFLKAIATSPSTP